MTLMWRGGRPEWSAGLDALEARGLTEEGALTVAGQRLRQRIEEETNRAMRPVFELGDDHRQGLLTALAELPGAIH